MLKRLRTRFPHDNKWTCSIACVDHVPLVTMTSPSSRSFADAHPDLVPQWHPSKNGGLSPFSISSFSHQKVWWVCPLGHEWEASIAHRSNGGRCPYCSHRKLLRGFNDFATIHPELLREWDYEKNLNIDPTAIPVHSTIIVWWKCKRGHSWQSKVDSRSCGHGCPFCSHHRVVVGETDLAHLYPEVAKEWDYQKNFPLTPDQVASASNKKVWWRCSKGHEWLASCEKRTLANRGCPFCSNTRALPGYNDFAHCHPELLLQWDNEKNKDIFPNQVLPHSEKKVWWKCDKGHSYQMMIGNKSNGAGCPICSSQVLDVHNCLATVRPDLLSQWDYSKNTIDPSSVFSHSHIKVWWKCPLGHSYKMWVYSKADGGGCPQCDAEKRTSFSEQAIGFYFRQAFQVESRTKVKGYEIDVYLPEVKVGIEYDGLFYHEGAAARKREEKKNQVLTGEGILLIRVKETKGRNERIGNIIYCSWTKQYSNLAVAISHIARIIEERSHRTIRLDINIDRDKGIITHQYYVQKQANSIAALFPFVAQKWDQSKNGDTTPEMVSAKSGQYYWWKCPTCGNEWFGSVCNQTNGLAATSAACPKCIRMGGDRTTLATGYSLGALLPDLAKDWHPTRNASLTPSDVTPGSHKIVWWKCHLCGHEWATMVKTRATGNRNGCRNCQRLSYTTTHTAFLEKFRTNNPHFGSLELLEQYHNSKTPIQVKCRECGYVWKAHPISLIRGSGCKQCRQRKHSHNPEKR